MNRILKLGKLYNRLDDLNELTFSNSETDKMRKIRKIIERYEKSR